MSDAAHLQTKRDELAARIEQIEKDKPEGWEAAVANKRVHLAGLDKEIAKLPKKSDK